MFKHAFCNFCLWFLCVVIGIVGSSVASAQQEEQTISSSSSINQLFSLIRANLSSDHEKVAAAFAVLDEKTVDLSQEQLTRYHLLKASFLGLSGKHKQRADLVNKVLNGNIDTNARIKFYYQLSDSYVKLGHYERALNIMNQGLQAMPRSTDANAKFSMLQGAITLMLSLNAFDEAMEYALRMHKLGLSINDNNYVCEGLANIVDVKFKHAEQQIEQQEIDRVYQVCDASDYRFISDIIRAAAAIYLINQNQLDEGIAKAYKILQVFEAEGQSSDYVRDLYVALAKANHQLNQLDKAEQYALKAFEQASEHQAHDTLKNASLLLAKIKRAQGLAQQALEYYDIYLFERDSEEKDSIAKNLAYQRVKYESLDKTNQIELLKVKNSSLSLTHKLQQRNNENLVLVVSLGTVLLVFMSILLVLSFKRKHALMYENHQAMEHQVIVDGVTVTQQAFAESKHKQSAFAVMLFELDFMARYETLLDEQSCQVLLDMVANACREQLRLSDQFGRISEHRFVICLIDSAEQGAKVLAERCQHLISQIELEDESVPTPITTTFGIAILDDMQCDYDEAMSHADEALQKAKEIGQNTIYVNAVQGEDDESSE